MNSQKIDTAGSLRYSLTVQIALDMNPFGRALFQAGGRGGRQGPSHVFLFL